MVLTVGVTTNGLEFELPGFQVKPTAVGASALRLVVAPGQLIVGVAVMVMLGPGSTKTVTVAEEVQLPAAPTTVYTVVTEGVTITIPPI